MLRRDTDVRRELVGESDDEAASASRGPAPRAPARGPSRRALADTARSVVEACSSAITGLELCARRARDEATVVASASAADFLRALLAATGAVAAERGLDVEPRPRTGDRLRWEWLASTATAVDGAPEGRLLSECARVLSEALTAAVEIDALGEGIAARLRVASAEAYSLASALRYRRRGDLALALT